MEREVYNNMRTVEQDHWWFRARRTILADQIERMNLAGNPQILEVGCGTGGNLEMLSRYGEVIGLEPDDESRIYAAERSGRPVVSGMLPHALPSFPHSFDLIAALDVIEHLDEDESSIRALGQLLKPGGRMITTVPAHPWMWSHHDQIHHHKRRYRKSEYLDMFDRSGLKVARASYFNSLLFPAIAFARLMPSTERSHNNGDAVPPAPVNALFHSIFACEKWLLRSFDIPFGVSVLVVAERPS